MILSEQREGRLVIDLEPVICPVSEAIAHISSQTEVLDISVSGVSAEEMVAGLYREYQI
jgi:ABC-2 type transport system ATP-binding protein